MTLGAKARYFLLVAFSYVLWLLLGIAGGHHFFLGRRHHGLLWLCTGGGFIGGWLLDFANIGCYVSESLADFQAHRGEAKCSMKRWIGQLLTGMWFGFVANWTIPRTVWDCLYDHQESKFGRDSYVDMLLLSIPVYISVAISAGVYLAGCVGDQLRSFRSGFWGALPIHVLMFTISRQYSSLFWSVFIASTAANRNARFKTERNEGLSKKRLFLCYMAYSLFMGIVAWNLPVPTVEPSGFVHMSGKRLGPTLVESVRKLTWNDVTAFVKFVNLNGWKGLKDRLREHLETILNILTEFDRIPDLKESARKILGLDLDKATKTEVQSTCRKLLRKYHPDMQHSSTESERKHSYAKYLEVQDVCDNIKRSTSSIYKDF